MGLCSSMTIGWRLKPGEDEIGGELDKSQVVRRQLLVDALSFYR